MPDDRQYMQRAIEIARGNPRAPFAAILVDLESGQVVAEGLNRVNRNPVLHGEIDAINGYASSGASSWSRLRLYTTAEPCCMCQAAVIWAGIPEVVFGTCIDTLRKLGWKQFDLSAEAVVAKAPFARCEVRGGVLAEQCDQMFEEARA